MSWTLLHLVAIILYIFNIVYIVCIQGLLRAAFAFAECHRCIKTQVLVSGSQTQLSWELRQIHLCRAKDKPSKRWDELWVLETVSVRRLIQAGDSPAVRLICE